MWTPILFHHRLHQTDESYTQSCFFRMQKESGETASRGRLRKYFKFSLINALYMYCREKKCVNNLENVMLMCCRQDKLRQQYLRMSRKKGCSPLPSPGPRPPPFLPLCHHTMSFIYFIYVIQRQPQNPRNGRSTFKDPVTAVGPIFIFNVRFGLLFMAIHCFSQNDKAACNIYIFSTLLM